METIIEMLRCAGFERENIRHFIDFQPLQGEQYFEYEKCFVENYRKADSGWALMSDDDQLAVFLKKMKMVRRRGRSLMKSKGVF